MEPRCRNDRCEFALGCSIRIEDEKSSRGPDAGSLLVGAPPQGATPSAMPLSGAVNFSVRHPQDGWNGCGWIGCLKIHGRLDCGAAAAIVELTGHLKNLDGLLVDIDSPGGHGNAGRALYALVVVVQAWIPVVCFVRRRCMSAPTLALLAADAALSHPAGELGGFGNLYPICDGLSPRSLVSPQSPQKSDGRAFASDLMRLYAPDQQSVETLVSELRENFESDFEIVLRHRPAADPRRLREVLDGRCLTSTEAKEVGLIDGICGEDEAYTNLYNLIRKRKAMDHDADGTTSCDGRGAPGVTGARARMDRAN